MVLANPGTTLGSGSEAQLTAPTTASANKFTVFGWNSPTTTSYLKFKMRTTSSGTGTFYIHLGSGATTLYQDASGGATYTNSLAAIIFSYSGGAITSVLRRNSGTNTAITSSGFAKDSDQQIEIYGNNSAGTESYSRSGTNYTLNVGSWDMWVDGTKISPTGGWGGTGGWSTGNTIGGFGFITETSASNAAVMYLDDLEYSNALPAPVPAGTSVQFVSTSSSAAENSGTANLALAITNPSTTNATTVTIGATGATGRISGFSTSVTFPANTIGNQNCVVTLNDDLLCNANENVVFTITGISGGTPTAVIGTNSAHTLTVNNDDVCTSVAFGGTNQTVSEGAGTANLTVTITNPSPSQSTSVQVALLSGNGARVNNYTTQTVTFPANSSADQTVTLTITDDNLCNGNETLTFQLQSISGGQGTPFIGTPIQRTVTVNDNETASAPTATAASGIGYGDFTANWNAITGATGYWLDVSTFSDFMVPTSTTVVEWNFPAATNDNIADGGIAGNSSKLLTGNGVANLAYNSAGNGGLTARADGWNNGSGTKFWQVEFESTGYGDIRVSSKQRSSGTGPRDFKLQYRIGTGGTWTDVTGGTVTTADNYTTGVLSNLSLPAECANQGQVFLRWIMTSNTNVNNTTVAAGGASNIDDVVVAGRALSFVAGYENLSVGNVTSYNVTGLTPVTNYHYRVRSAGGCSTGGNSNTISVTTSAVPTYYSQSNGNVNDPIWADAPVGTPGPAIWTAGSSMVVQGGDTVTVNGNTNINDLTLEATSRLVINNEQLLTVHGDQLTLANFTLSPVSGEVELAGTAPVTMAVTGTVNFNDLTVNTASGTTVTGGVGIFGTLLLADGDFDATAATVQLRSDATRTGRLGPVAATADYLGDLTVQRYIPGGATNWRLLGSPVAGATVNGWQDDFITAGYPGSQFPNFQDPPGSGNLWPSIRWYDETNTFADVDSGLVGVSSNLQSLAQGQGFAVWCGDNLGATNPFTIDITGAPHIASAPIQLPMTFTSTGNPTIDGWNLVSNPVPSAVLFSNLARTNVDDYITYYNPAIGNSAVYDISLGFGLNGATNTIQSGQAFWLKANAAAPVVQVEETDKVAGNAGGLFGGDQLPQVPGLRLQVSSDLNTYSDETLVVFAEGTPAVDAQDVTKVILAHPAAPQIGTRGPGNELLAINAYGAYANDIVIPLMVNVGVTGAYTITASTLAPLGLTCLSLEDLVTGTVTPIGEGAAYTFTMEADADPAQLRFQLRASAPLPFSALNATCANSPNGQASVEVAQGPVEVTWTDAFGTVLLQQTVSAGTASFGGLQAGSYAVQVSAGGACAQLSMPFTISAPFELEAVTTVADASCPNVADGALDLMVLGGTAPYAFAWSNGATTEDLVAGAGVYTVTVTDANGCAWSSDGLTIASGTGPDAEIFPVAGPLLVGQEQLFQAAVVDNVSYAWDLGDGTVAEGAEVVHTYMMPGNYTVTMTVEDGLCMASSTIDITVELSTGISGQDRNVLRAWQMHDQLVVELGLEVDGRAVVDVLDATGQLIMQRTAAASTDRILLPANGLASGVYFIRVTAGRDQRTLRVPVVH